MKEIFNEFLTPYLKTDVDIKNIVQDIFGITNFQQIAELVIQSISPY